MKQFLGIKINFDGIWSETIRLAKVPGKTFDKTIILVFLITLSSDFLKAQDLKVMSFNILYATAAPKNWETGRRALVTKTILQENPDIIGLQEVMDLQHSDLEIDLADTYRLFTPSNKSYFGNSIGYRKTRFTEINKGRFTYSPTPDIPGTDFHGGTNSRYASWVILSDNQTGDSVFVVSTHFYSPREQQDERVWSSQILMARIQELANGLPIIAVGDFNMLETEDAYNEIVEYHINPLTDTYRSLHASNPSIDGTFHGSVNDYPAPTNKIRIDYIFSAHLNIVESEILHTTFDGDYPSDHFPVTARLTYDSVPEPEPEPNVINPGGIMGGKAFCGSFDTQTLYNVADAFGGCSNGTIQYQWQRRTRDACSSNWEPWVTTERATNLSSSWLGDTRDMQFRRGAKRSDCGDWQYSNVITMDVNTPLSDPGEISGSIESCGWIDPGPLVSIREASGGCGELEYMWQGRSRDACSAIWPDWTDYTTHIGLTFDPGNWYKDRQYRRAARRKGCSWQYSNSVTIDVFESGSSDPNCNCDAMSVNTGINNLQTDRQKLVKVFPNPATTTLEIDIAATTTVRSVNFFSPSGQLVFLLNNHEKLSGFSEIIDIQNWESGIYLVGIETNEFTDYRKIIVQ